MQNYTGSLNKEISLLKETIIFKNKLIEILEAENLRLKKENAELKSTNKRRLLHAA